ncbi:MAG: hypothetical protein ISS63_09520 [Desulfobacteraceae bacterium]|nr:hypothetical protein [Desulfobacteraceae bacterium]
MTKKITISVPDDLHEKMEGWKDSFNFSGIFQDAIREKIQRKEDFQQRIEKGGFDMEAAVQRLKAERKAYYGDFYDAGKESGFTWAMNAHYEDLKKALSWEVIQATLPEQLIYGDSPIKDEAYDIIIDDDLIYDIPLQNFSLSEYANDTRVLNFGAGWLAGVQEFWNQIKDKL